MSMERIAGSGDGIMLRSLRCRAEQLRGYGSYVVAVADTSGLGGLQQCVTTDRQNRWYVTKEARSCAVQFDALEGLYSWATVS